MYVHFFLKCNKVIIIIIQYDILTIIRLTNQTFKNIFIYLDSVVCFNYLNFRVLHMHFYELLQGTASLHS